VNEREKNISQPAAGKHFSQAFQNEASLSLAAIDEATGITTTRFNSSAEAGYIKSRTSTLILKPLPDIALVDFTEKVYARIP